MQNIAIILVRVLRKINRFISGFFQRTHHLALLKIRKASFNSNDLVFYGKCILHIGKRAKITIGRGFVSWGGAYRCIDNNRCSKIIVGDGAELVIGNESGISNAIIDCAHSIIIGNYVKIGAGCIISDNSLNSNAEIKHDNKQSLFIGDHVFLGMRSIVTGCVHIGNKAIIAAGSVVKTDIPEGEIWGGNPACFIKRIIEEKN